MSDITYIKIEFRSVPPGSAYFAGTIAEVPEYLAEQYIDAGHAKRLTGTLPEDFPGREQLIAAGIFTTAEIKAVAKLEDLPGIGKATAERIRKALETA